MNIFVPVYVLFILVNDVGNEQDKFWYSDLLTDDFLWLCQDLAKSASTLEVFAYYNKVSCKKIS